eukprot:scaffold34918_cov84-Amphora_coffeaeformis.AAC.1
MDPKKFSSHDTAEVTHTLLQDSTTRVLLIHSQYVPAVEKGDTLMVYTVGAGLLAPVQMMRHEKDKVAKMYPKMMKAVNLVQIATLPAWSGRNLGAIIMGNAMTERLQQAGYDLFLVICGCTRFFYQRLEIPSNPDWLEETPFNLAVPKEDEKDEDATEDDRAEDATKND